MTNLRITRVAKRAWVVGTFFGAVSWAVCVAMGALVGGAVLFNMALEGAAMAFVSFVVGSGLVLGIPNSGDFVVMWQLSNVVPMADLCES